MLSRVACPNEPTTLFGGIDVEDPGEELRLVRDDPDDSTADMGEEAGEVHREVREVLEVLPVVDDRPDEFLHVVGLVGLIGDEGPKRFDETVDRIGRRLVRWLLEIVLRQERQQVADVFETGPLVARDERGNARSRRMGDRPAELLGGDVLAGDGAHDVGAGDEHVARAVDHEDEVGERRGVDGASRRRPEDHGDLGDDPGHARVAEEDPPEAVQGRDALLDAGAPAVGEADERHPGLQGEVLDLVDLLGMRLTERASKDAEVLTVDADLTTLDPAESRDDTIGVGPRLQPDVVRAVPHERIELFEGTLVEQQIESFTGSQLSVFAQAVVCSFGAGAA